MRSNAIAKLVRTEIRKWDEVGRAAHIVPVD